MIIVAYSSKDVAGTNIAKQVLSHFPFAKTDMVFQDNPVYFAQINGKNINLVTLKDETVYAQHLPINFANPELVVFLSRHSSQSGKPTLSVHAPGNFGNAELGGLPRQVSVAPAKAMRDALKSLARLKTELNLDYEVSYECTHHGPSLNIPTMFVELGSSPLQWSDFRAAEAVARATTNAIANFGFSEEKAVLGIGGTHYNQRFTKMALKNEAIFGHMIPKYSVAAVDAEILRHCMERTLETVTSAIIDWKGVKGDDKYRLLKVLGDVGLPFEKV